jgi:hypothetical protein
MIGLSQDSAMRAHPACFGLKTLRVPALTTLGY